MSSATTNRYISSEEEQQLNQQLGLRIPPNVLTESIPHWVAFFRIVRLMYLENLISAENVPQMMADFAGIPDINKPIFNSKLYYLIETEAEKKNQLDELFYAKMEEDDIDYIASLLPEEMRLKFLYILGHGEEMPEDFLTETEDYLDTNGDQTAAEKLRRALDKRNTITSKSLQIDRNTGQALTPEEVAMRFNLDRSDDAGLDNQFANDSNATASPRPAPAHQPIRPIPPTIPKADNASKPSTLTSPKTSTPVSIPPMTGNTAMPIRDELDPYADVGSMNDQAASPANPVAGPVRQGPLGLDDLLGK